MIVGRFARLVVAWAAFFGAVGAHAADAPKPLFAGNEVIQIIIQGPLQSIARTRSEAPVPGSLALASGEVLPVNLSARGITRKTSEVCDFPPLRVEFSRPPPATSLFAGQRRLKLVTHCRKKESFQQHLLLEYAAYRMFNLLSPASFRARLANIDYRGSDGRSIVTRVGFFLEDTGDVARRNGVQEIHAVEKIPVTSLSPTESARYAMFQNMIANHDWSMRAAPAGEECCHNAKLIGSRQGGLVVPVPYDFDFSGLVSAPYAGPPPELNLSSVRQRDYRGYCIHNPQGLAIAAQFRSARPAILAVLNEIPGLEDRTRRTATNFLEQFFAEIATDRDAIGKVLKRCVS